MLAFAAAETEANGLQTNDPLLLGGDPAGQGLPSSHGVEIEETPWTAGVTGMTCAACAQRLQKVVKKATGWETRVSLALEEIAVTAPPDLPPRILEARVREAVRRAGYGLESPAEAAHARRVRTQRLRLSAVLAAALTLPLILSMFAPQWAPPPWLAAH